MGFGNFRRRIDRRLDALDAFADAEGRPADADRQIPGGKRTLLVTVVTLAVLVLVLVWFDRDEGQRYAEATDISIAEETVTFTPRVPDGCWRFTPEADAFAEFGDLVLNLPIEESDGKCLGGAETMEIFGADRLEDPPPIRQLGCDFEAIDCD